MASGRVGGGFNQYGFTVGILMLDTRFPRIPGDMGNAATFPFPVRYHRVPGADPDLVVRRGAAGLMPAFVEGAKRLESEGVGAITTNCGFLVKFQRELAAAVKVPVFTSALLLVPLVHRMLPPGRRVGIMTVNAGTLGPEHLEGAGIGRDIPLAARIIAVVDAYDAMTQDRSYRIRFDSSDAVAELLRCSPAQFDPQIVAAFLAVLGRH